MNDFIVGNPTIELVSMSSEAAQAVQNILDEKNMPGHALRVYVAGSSCSGVQFGLGLDDNIAETDTTLDIEGVKLVVDQHSLEYVRGAKIDFVNDTERGSGFTIVNPNAQGGGCGCGSNESSSCGGGDQGHGGGCSC